MRLPSPMWRAVCLSEYRIDVNSPGVCYVDMFPGFLAPDECSTPRNPHSPITTTSITITSQTHHHHNHLHHHQHNTTTATTTKIFNDLSCEVGGSGEAVQVQHYNVLARSKTTNMDSGSRNLPGPDAKEKNKSRDAASTSNAAAAAAAAASTREKIINKSIPHRFSFRSGPADKGKKQIKRGLSLSLRRSALWSTLHAKTMEIPERLRREERKLAKVPRLQIWLSTDQSPREPPPGEQQVLNNTREPLPKLDAAEVRPSGAGVSVWQVAGV
ncbi:hypothetical protein O3P69_002410 [Scylla paramamosain]|uniref:Uncharacterized protein n=1 Tax=Scylla paramamosain TaxID=85552 RepID=A0AAW0V6M0_SCYPA